MSWTREKIENLLRTNPIAVERAILFLYKMQEEDEKRASEVRHSNNVGFKKCHGNKGSYYARWILSGRHLTGHHLENARKIALCHAGTQLLARANGELS